MGMLVAAGAGFTLQLAGGYIVPLSFPCQLI